MSVFWNEHKSGRAATTSQNRAIVWTSNPSVGQCPTVLCDVTVNIGDRTNDVLRYESENCKTGELVTEKVFAKPTDPFDITLTGKISNGRDLLHRLSTEQCPVHIAVVNMCDNRWQSIDYYRNVVVSGVGRAGDAVVRNGRAIDEDNVVQMVTLTFSAQEHRFSGRSKFSSTQLVSGATTATTPLSQPTICPRYGCTDCNGNPIGDKCGLMFVLEAAANRIWYMNALGQWNFFTVAAPAPTMIRCTDLGLMIVRPPAAGTGTTYTIVGYNSIPANGTALPASTTWTTVSTLVMSDAVSIGGYVFFAGTVGTILRLDLRTGQIVTQTIGAQTYNDIDATYNANGGITVVAVGNVWQVAVSNTANARGGLGFALATFPNINTLTEVRLIDYQNAYVVDSLGNRWSWTVSGFASANTKWVDVPQYTALPEIQFNGIFGWAAGMAGTTPVISQTVDAGCSWGSALLPGETLPVTLTAITGIAVCPAYPDVVLVTGTTNTGQQVVLTGTAAV